MAVKSNLKALFYTFQHPNLRNIVEILICASSPGRDSSLLWNLDTGAGPTEFHPVKPCSCGPYYISVSRRQVRSMSFQKGPRSSRPCSETVTPASLSYAYIRAWFTMFYLKFYLNISIQSSDWKGEIQTLLQTSEI